LKLVTETLRATRANKAEAMPEAGIPDPPPELSAVAKVEWLEVSKKLNAAGLLTTIDRAALAAYCQAFGRWVQAERVLAEMAARDPETAGLMIETTNGNLVQNPMVGTANTAMRDMMRYAVEFGMTPSARSRVRANQLATQKDPAEQFFG
jgi:P27 family predicted phage terminase small subunit